MSTSVAPAPQAPRAARSAPLRSATARRIGLATAAPLLAVAGAVLICSLVLLGTGDHPIAVFRSMLSFGSKPESIVAILNRSTTYYLSALAVAVGFRMNLFNIGVDGQYRLAAMLAAAVGGAVHLPPVLHVALILAVAALVGAVWAGIAGLLKVTRGVSEVISTIMLNFVATGLVAYLLTPQLLAVRAAGSNNIGTKPIAASGQVPGLGLVPGATTKVFGLLLLAIAAGVGYWLLVGRTRFGFDLRATGISAPAAVASGVNVRRMVVSTMLLSGAVAGLVGMPQLLGDSYSYSLDFPAGLGFTGIAIALLGRNSPIGIGIGALLFAFLDQSSQILDLEGVPKEIVTIMQGTIVLSVVIVYELVHRYAQRVQQQALGASLGTATPAKAQPAVAP